jgi:hypothetical protein
VKPAEGRDSRRLYNKKERSFFFIFYLGKRFPASGVVQRRIEFQFT